MRRTSITVGALTFLAGCRDAITAPTLDPSLARASVARASEPGYTAVEFPALAGGDLYGAVAFAINARGQIAGASNIANSGYFHATRWVNREPEDLGTLGGTSSGAADINNVGDVVGGAMNDLGYSHAFLFTDEGGMEDLGTLGGKQSGATAINDYGVVVGSSDMGPFVPARAFRWTRAAGMQDLGTLPGGPSTYAVDINNKGEIVGAADTPAGTRAVLWTSGGEIIDLGTLPNSVRYSDASAINERGEIVGSSFGGDSGYVRAVLWTTNREIVDLGVLPGDVESYAYGINDAGVVVGVSFGRRGYRSFVWTKDGGMQALPVLPGADGAFATFAYDINNAGTAAGYSVGLRWHAVQWARSLSPTANLTP
jgi:probable HAF family extracellular repeat protein